MSAPDPISGGTWQLIVHPAATDALVSWLRSRGLDIALFSSGGDDLPTYTLTPSTEETNRGQ